MSARTPHRALASACRGSVLIFFFCHAGSRHPNLASFLFVPFLDIFRFRNASGMVAKVPHQSRTVAYVSHSFERCVFVHFAKTEIANTHSHRDGCHWSACRGPNDLNHVLVIEHGDEPARDGCGCRNERADHGERCQVVVVVADISRNRD